ncbi:hypothetical protein DFQ28_009761 [Apophysomyces sp. BC1034]|nr:hypothetical protein DFQ28_009761 [Apophysomyces sp. BC1034]
MKEESYRSSASETVTTFTAEIEKQPSAPPIDPNNPKIPALQDIREYFGTNLTTINATVSLFVMVTGVAPLFWAPLSERIGRRWVYIVSSALFTVFTIICGVATNLGLFFAMRLLQGICASAGQAVGGGSVADLFEARERGKAMSIFMLGVILGPAVAPLIGGYVDQYLGWRWIFYIKTILGGVIFLLNFVFLRETLYTPSSDLPAPTTFRERLARLKFNPLRSLALLLRPVVILTNLPMAVTFGWFYLLITVLPLSFVGKYGFSTGSIGLCYLASGIGNCSGSIVGGLVSDRMYTWQANKNGGISRKEDRLLAVYIAAPFIVVGYLIYGWTLYYGVFWFAPLVGFTTLTFGMMFVTTVVTTYLVDCYLPMSASVVSVANFARNMMAMMFSLLAVTVRGSLGDGWTL